MRSLPITTTATRAAACALAALGTLGTTPALRADSAPAAAPATTALVLQPAYSPLPIGWLARAHAAVSNLQGGTRNEADLAAEERAFRASFLAGRLFTVSRPLSPLSINLESAPFITAAPVTEEAVATPAVSPLPADFAAAYSFFRPLPTVSATTTFSTDALSTSAGSSSVPASTFTAGHQGTVSGFQRASAGAPTLASAAFVPPAPITFGLAGLTSSAMRPIANPAATTTTSGTLTPTASYNYSTAPWVITAGDGTYPDLGGTATFLTGVGATPGALFVGSAITIDVSPTLSQINYNSPFTTNLTAGTSTSIVAATTGLTLNVIQSSVNTPTFFSLPNLISTPISGGGTVGVTKTGSGTLNLSGSNTFTGGLHVNGGLVAIQSTAAVGDAVFGAAGEAISIDGGALFLGTTGGLTTARNVTIGAGGATLYGSTATTFSGVISGTGSLTNAGFATAGVVTLTGANTYTGATTNSSNVSSIVLSGNGSIANSSSYDLTGALTLSNTATNVTNRLSDTAAVTLRGVNIVSTGNASAASSETIGAVTAANSVSTVLVTPGSGQTNSLTLASLSRQNNATVILRGAGLGIPAAGGASIYATTAPTLTGGGGASSTALSILPYAIGNSGTTTTFTATGLVGSSFVTYDANGFRPLATTEYATAFGGSNLDNVRLTAATAAGSGVTANAVLFAPAAAATLSGGTINVTSGAFLYSPTANATGTVSAALSFGGAEGIITNTSALVLSGVLSGSNGVTYTTAYAPSPATASITLSGASTYTGNTTINSGNVSFAGTVPAAGSASVFGNSGTVVLAGGINSATLNATAAATLNRDISSTGTGVNYIANAGTGTFTLNGNIGLTNNLYIYGNSNTAAAAFNFNGNITGTGGIIDTTLGYSIFSGNNTFSGGVTLPATSTFVAGSDTAFGTGPIYITGAGTLQGLGTTARTLANTLFVASTPTLGGTAPLTFTGGVNFNGGSRTLTVSNTALTAFNGVVANGAFTKGGNGAIALNSSTGNTFSGGFVNTGAAATASAIYANNTSGSAFGTGAVSVGAASATVYSTLAGSFITSGATTIGGRLSPGNTPAALTPATAGVGAIGTASFGGALTLSPTTSSLYFDIAGAPGTNGSNDKVNVGGLLTFGGTTAATATTVNFATANGYTVQAGDKFDFLDWGTLSAGTITYNFSNVTFASGVGFDTSSFLTDGTLTATAVPEPATVLGGLLTAALGFLGWKRRARA